MTIGEQNNKNIMGLLHQIQSIPIKPYDDSPSVIKCEKCGEMFRDDGDDWCPKCRRKLAIQIIEPDDDALFEFKRDREVKEREVDGDLLFEQARELKRERSE